MSWRNFLLLLTFLISLNLPAQDSFNLSSCIDYALQSSWSSRQNQLNILDAKEQISEYKAIGLPQLNASVDFQRFLELPTSIFPAESFGPDNPPDDLAVQFGVLNNVNAGVDLSMLLLDGSYFVGLKAIKSYLDLVQKQTRVDEFELRYTIREAYYAILLAQEGKSILDLNIDNLESTLSDTRAIYENGFIEKLDVDRLELNYNNLITQRDNQEQLIRVAKNALKLQMNYPMDEDITIEGNLEDFLSGSNQARNVEDIESDFSKRPELELLVANKKLQDLNVKQNKFKKYPSIVGYGNYNQQLQGDKIGDAQWFPSSFVGLRLQLPLFNGFDLRTKTRRAQIASDRVSLQQAQLEEAMKFEFQNALVQIENARKTLNQARDSKDQAENIYQITKIKFEEGVGSSLELTQAERDLYTNQANYLNASYDLIIAEMKLDKSLGIK